MAADGDGGNRGGGETDTGADHRVEGELGGIHLGGGDFAAGGTTQVRVWHAEDVLVERFLVG